jgi:hypothetical protein
VQAVQPAGNLHDQGSPTAISPGAAIVNATEAPHCACSTRSHTATHAAMAQRGRKQVRGAARRVQHVPRIAGNRLLIHARPPAVAVHRQARPARRQRRARPLPPLHRSVRDPGGWGISTRRLVRAAKLQIAHTAADAACRRRAASAARRPRPTPSSRPRSPSPTRIKVCGPAHRRIAQLVRSQLAAACSRPGC